MSQVRLRLRSGLPALLLAACSAASPTASGPPTPAPDDGGSPSTDPPPQVSSTDSNDPEGRSAASRDPVERAPEMSGGPAPTTCSIGTPCAPGGPCPDLVVDAAALSASVMIQTIEFPASACEFFEGCIAQPGRRKVMRFRAVVGNIGTADLVLGAPADGPCFEYSNCHSHYHFTHFALYTLRAEGGTLAASGRKQAFCVQDNELVPGFTPPRVITGTELFDCKNQGLHIGYQDIYAADLPCQWVDITGLASGNYVLTVDVNTERVMPESRFDNNSASTTVFIPP